MPSVWETRRVTTITTPAAEAHIYKTPRAASQEFDTYYFCCSCGNCGRRWTGRKPATEEAIRHVMDHPVY